MELAGDFDGAAPLAAEDARRTYPPTRALRSRLRRGAEQAAAGLTTRGAAKDALAGAARELLGSLQESESFLGWTTVRRRSRVLAVGGRGHSVRPADPIFACEPARIGGQRHSGRHRRADSSYPEARRRPGLSRRADGGSAGSDAAGFGRPGGAVFGAAELDVLEKAFDLLAPLELPALAIPLPSDGDDLDLDWLEEIVRTPYAPDGAVSGRYAQTLAAAQALAEPDELAALAPRRLADDADAATRLRPLAAAEQIAYEFLSGGGKHFRPFITLAAFDAVRAGGDSDDGRPQFPDAVRRLALAIETFHKASLVHDDIEDADDFRYGEPALHARYGEATAINVGDFLIGLGYRLISDGREELGAEAVADVSAFLADAHLRLAQGQGAEIAWRDAESKELTPPEAMRFTP